MWPPTTSPQQTRPPKTAGSGPTAAEAPVRAPPSCRCCWRQPAGASRPSCAHAALCSPADMCPLLTGICPLLPLVPRPRPCTPCSRQPGHALSPSRLHRLLLPGLQQGCGGGLQQPAPQAVQQIQGTQHPHPPAGVPASWPPAWAWAHATAMQCLPAARRAAPNMQRAVVRLPLSHTGCIL